MPAVDPPPIEATLRPTRPSSVILSASLSSRPARPRSATHTTGNSSPLAAWIVISRTASMPLGLERRLALAGAQQVLLGDEVDEAAELAALLGLVLAREPHQLADVGHAPLAARHAQHAPVVAGAGHRPVDHALEREPRRRLALGPEALDEGAHARTVGLRRAPPRLPPRASHQTSRPRSLARSPIVASASEGRPDERRGEQRVERQLVARVGERRQVGAQVAAPAAGSSSRARRRRRWEGRARRSRARRPPCRCWHAAVPRPVRARTGRPVRRARRCAGRAGGPRPSARRAPGPAARRAWPRCRPGRRRPSRRGPPRAARRWARPARRRVLGALPQRLEVLRRQRLLEGRVEHVEQLAAAAEVVRDAGLAPGRGGAPAAPRGTPSTSAWRNR